MVTDTLVDPPVTELPAVVFDPAALNTLSALPPTDEARLSVLLDKTREDPFATFWLMDAKDPEGGRPFV